MFRTGNSGSDTVLTNVNNDLKTFDKLPRELRDLINYAARDYSARQIWTTYLRDPEGTLRTLRAQQCR